MGMTNEEEVILALKELKDWEGLPYCIEEPMQNEGIAVITNEALDKAIKALEAQERLTEMLNKQMTAYAEMEKSRHLNDLEYGRKTAYAHCLEVLTDDE